MTSPKVCVSCGLPAMEYMRYCRKCFEEEFVIVRKDAVKECEICNKMVASENYKLHMAVKHRKLIGEKK